MPDVNSLSALGAQSTSSRPSSSQQMPPPPNPSAAPSSPSLNILPSNQSTVNNGGSGSALSSPRFPPGAPPQADHGPGPLRHPRPLTAADLHLELEKEQEAVVNRLTRELSLLRAAQNASVASTTSSTSAAASAHADQQQFEPHPLISGSSGFTIPSSAGRLHHNRSASNTSIRSTRSTSQIATAGSSTPAGPRANPIPIPLSRQNSQQSRRSRTSSPVPGSESFGNSLGAGYFSSYRMIPTSIPTSAAAMAPGSTEPSPGLLPATRQLEEAAYYRAELDSVKRENETLRHRIRELERNLRTRRESDASRPRSESVSTTASASVVGTSAGAAIAGPRDSSSAQDRERALRPERDRGASSMSLASSVGVGVPEDEVKVGESAASKGVHQATPAVTPAS